MNMSFMVSSIGIISHFMPVGVTVHVILHIIIGIMPPIIGIMLFIIGIIPPIIGIMPLIIGIIPLIIGMFIGMATFMVGSVLLAGSRLGSPAAIRALIRPSNGPCALSGILLR